MTGTTTPPAVSPVAMTRSQKQGVITAIICTAMIALAWGLSSPLISQHLERMTASGLTLGWLISLAAVATVLATPFVPKLMSWFWLILAELDGLKGCLC